MNLTSVCGLSLVSRQGMESHIGSKEGAFVEASSARGAVDLSLSHVANGARSAIDRSQGHGGNRRCERSRHNPLTMIQTLQPGIGLALGAFSHFAMLPMRARWRYLIH